MTAPPDRIRAWVWDLPYPSKAQGRAEWSAAMYPAEQNSAEYVRLDLHTAAVAAAEARGREQGLRAGLDHACSVIDAHSEYDQNMCCSGHECGCQGSSVHQAMKHWISSWTDAPPADGGDT